MCTGTVAVQGIRGNTAALLAGVVGDYWRYVLTLVFYATCWPIGGIAMSIDRFSGSRSLELLLRLCEAVDEGRFR